MGKHALQQVLEDAGYECQSYSGRGMNCKECLAVRITNGAHIGKLFADVLDNMNADDVADYNYANGLVKAFRVMRTDNLGHDTIVYFPGAEYSDGTTILTHENGKVCKPKEDE